VISTSVPAFVALLIENAARLAGINRCSAMRWSAFSKAATPSASFDTRGYLAANPDVAAAGVNPLDHFLLHGIFEGRQAVNDGLFN
jgi:serralysin